MAKIKIIVRQQQLSNGCYPVVLRLAHKKQPATFIRLNGLYIHNPNEWSNALCRFTPKKPDYRELNKTLASVEDDADLIVSRLTAKNVFSYHRFRKEYFKAEDVSVFKCYESKIRELKRTGHIGNALAYNTSLTALKKYTRDIFFTDINYKLLQGFETLCKERGSKGNTIYLYFRQLRAIHYNYCRQNDLPKPTVYEKFKISRFKEETAKRSLNEQQLKYIIDNELPRLSFSRDIFLFSFFCRGMNVRDIALLTKSDISNETITYRRSKTGVCSESVSCSPLKTLLIGTVTIANTSFRFSQISTTLPRRYRSESRMLTRTSIED